MSLTVVLIILLLIVLIGGAPGFGYHAYGYWPSSAAGILLLVVLVFLLMGRL
jgi:membrane protein YdbS with pleckstrin-like domain